MKRPWAGFGHLAIWTPVVRAWSDGARTALAGGVPMNSPLPLSGTLRSVFDNPIRGVVGLVDDLLLMCQEQGLQLDWQADRCQVRSLAGGSEEIIDKPVRKSVFRAILARVAALCNERTPNSVSPYGGQGELLVGCDPPMMFKVTFANTPDEQKLQLVPVPACRPGR